MLVVATGDWHLDAHLHGRSRFVEIASAARRSVEVAIERKAGLYVFGGDGCDPDSGPVVFRCVELFIECALALVKAGIRTIFMPGNHCVLEDNSGDTVLSPLRAVAKYESLLDVPHTPSVRVFEPFGLVVVTLPFVATSHAYDPEAFIQTQREKFGSERRVLIFSHLSVEGIVPGEETLEMPRGRSVFLPLKMIGECFSKATVVQFHYHRRQVFRSRGMPDVYVAGSLARLTHGEEDHEPGILCLSL